MYEDDGAPVALTGSVGDALPANADRLLVHGPPFLDCL
jgi:hypothetical protein